MADNREKLWKLTDSLGVTPRLSSDDKDKVFKSGRLAILVVTCMAIVCHSFGHLLLRYMTVCCQECCQQTLPTFRASGFHTYGRHAVS